MNKLIITQEDNNNIIIKADNPIKSCEVIYLLACGLKHIINSENEPKSILEGVIKYLKK